MQATLKNILVKRKALTITGVTTGLVILALVLLAARSNKPAAAAPRPLDVQVVTVEQKDVPVYSEWIGTTDGAVNAEIKAQITGYLLHQTYKEGAFVKKGELLFDCCGRIRCIFEIRAAFTNTISRNVAIQWGC